MSIHYSCRYCGHFLGKVDQSVEEERLGFHLLSTDERESIISQQENGETQVKIVCEHCQEALDRHPESILYQSIHH